ncbi:hypothetical protein TIFTF001_027417 [Ficus carica]|uniref:Uncharacterized protein n=1 Tax=Ficus carica TaxID=3494 RepID=A0AA88J093_FICCA|nr:hypothetical protein TIFTF001_027417 [Ficus carica]
MAASEDETSAIMDEIGESLLYTASAGAPTADETRDLLSSLGGDYKADRDVKQITTSS